MAIRYREVIGTPAADSLVATGRSLPPDVAGEALFGLGANDTLAVGTGVQDVLGVGGSGSDTYVLTDGGALSIVETGGDADGLFMNTTSLTSNFVTATIIDGDHLAITDLEEQQIVILFDWTDPVSRVELFEFAEGPLTFDQLFADLNGNPAVQQQSWEQFTAGERTTAEVNELIDFYSFRSALLEAQTLPTVAQATPLVARLYTAAFDRAPDGDGLDFWVNTVRGGTSIGEVGSLFLGTPEAQDQFGVNPTDQQFVDQLYLNVLDRFADSGGFNFWDQRIDEVGRGQVLAEFSNTPENVERTQDVLDDLLIA